MKMKMKMRMRKAQMVFLSIKLSAKQNSILFIVIGICEIFEELHLPHLSWEIAFEWFLKWFSTQLIDSDILSELASFERKFFRSLLIPRFCGMILFNCFWVNKPAANGRSKIFKRCLVYFSRNYSIDCGAVPTFICPRDVSHRIGKRSVASSNSIEIWFSWKWVEKTKKNFSECKSVLMRN